jgi:t-SNARE complex subunit (syntaxin)
VNLNDLNDAEQFQKHFVAPMVEAVRLEVKQIVGPLIKQQADDDTKTADHEKRIAYLEGTMKKAIWTWGIIVSAATFAVQYGWSKIKSKIFPG